MRSRELGQKLVILCLMFIGSVTLGIGIVLLSGGSLRPLAQTDAGLRQSSAEAARVSPASTTEAVVGTAPSTPAPTNSTPAPTNSPVAEPTLPTATPSPPATPTVAPATPDSPNTPNALASSTFLQDTFDTPTSGWPVRDEATWSAAYTDGRYQLTLSGRPTTGVSIPLPDADYRITVDVIPGQQGDVGLIVLFDGATSFYQLGLRPNGSYTIQRLDEDTITNVTEWANNSELKPGAGVANRIRMERQGSTVSFYANGQFLTDFTVPDESFRNRFGFTITSPTSQGEVGFDNLVGEVLNDS